MNQLILLGSLAFSLWLIYRDCSMRRYLTAAVWIPTAWVAILSSRPLSMWLGWGGGESSLEGSPMDRLFYFALIFAAVVVLQKRRVNWGQVISGNWPIFIFYFYLLATGLWADSPLVALKRWVKELGNVLVALVILTEVNPLQALRAVFVRCGYLWLPLSVVFIHYFPYLGRRYTIHSGQMEVTGVSVQKNSLGILVLVCGLMLIWDWLERYHAKTEPRAWIEKLAPLGMLALGGYLLLKCDSKTSLICLTFGGGLLLLGRHRYFSVRLSKLVRSAIVAAIVFFALDRMFGISEAIVTSMGRDMTFTDRTNIWAEYLALDTNPLFGAGYMSLYDDPYYRAKLSEWIPSSPHSGYIAVYLDGGWIGILVLVYMVIAIGRRMVKSIDTEGSYALVAFTSLAVLLIGNFAETVFATLTALWFMFLACALRTPQLTEALARTAAVANTPKLTAMNNPNVLHRPWKQRPD